MNNKHCLKKGISLLLIAIMMLSIIPFAEVTTQAASAKYTLCWPVPTNVTKIGKISSKFGPRVAPAPGASKYHRGVDIPAASGTDIYAVEDGVVKCVGYTSARGNYVVIYHKALKISTIYEHIKNKTTKVKKGEKVTAGQLIAKVG